MKVAVTAMLLIWVLCGVGLAEQNPPPTIVELYGRNHGESEVISGNCHSTNSRNTAISCDFIHLEVVQPSGDIDAATQTDLDAWEYLERPNTALASRLKVELSQLIPKEEKALQESGDEKLKQLLDLHREWLFDLQHQRPFMTEKERADLFKQQRGTDAKTQADLLNDPSAGPKLRAYYRKRFAVETDFAKWMKVEADKDARSCHGFLKTFSAHFKKVDEGRWLSNEIQAQEGPCQEVIVFELTDKQSEFQSLKERLISVGGSHACEAISGDEKLLPVKTYSGMGGESELQCDFVSWSGVGPSLSP